MNSKDKQAIFEQELEGLDLDSTFDVSTMTQLSLLPESSNNTNNNNNTRQDPHDVFVKSQHRFIVAKRLESRTRFNEARYEIKSENSTHVAVLELYHQWNSEDTKLKKGMLINIVDVQPKNIESFETYIVSRDGGFVIVEPDILVSITSVVGQLWCQRKTALSEFFKFPFDSDTMLRGTIAHDIIGRAMVDRVSDKEKLQELIQQCLSSPSIMNTAYSCKLTQQQAETMANELIPYIEHFVKDRLLRQQQDQNVKILNVCDIEDSYWNPVFGLKGKLDATVRIQNKNGQVNVVPLEFKIGIAANKGKNLARHDHTGQVSLYTLLMRPRYGLSNGGLLLYIREDRLKECTVQLGELQSLIIMRNGLAQSSVSEKGTFNNIPLPGNIDFDFKCSRCELKNVCTLMLRESNVGAPEFCTETELKLFESINHLQDADIAFFHRWMKVITLEIEEHNKTNNSMSFWKSKAEDREKYGQCISNLRFVHISPMEVVDAGGSRCYKLTLKKADGKSMTKTLLTDKDVIVLSTQDELCISYGSIEVMNDQYITLTVERKLNERSSQPHTRFIIDKIVSNRVLQMQYGNLSFLMEPTLEAQRLRNYIIGNQWNRGTRALPVFALLKESTVLKYKSFFAKYNDDQRKAILKAVTTDSFLFVKGMPGTGKTETIVGLLQLLSHQNCSVLVVAYTNNALDNILLKYRESNTDFLRVGSPSKLNPESLLPFSTACMSGTCKNIDDLTKMYNSKRIIGSTLMSLQHEIFRVRKTFDYVIVDEASQALPTCVFGALMLAKKFIFFGDPDQLPAIIKSPAVKKMGIEDSMFALVAQPGNTVKLSIQYRMNSAIMNLSNKLVYNDSMTCANEEQSENFVDLPSGVLKQHVRSLPSYKTQRWVSCVLSKKLVKSIVFLETSAWNAPDERIGESVRNTYEANIVRTCVDAFVTCGFSGANIGVIAPFRGQVSYIRHLFQDREVKFKQVEVNTVDQYQGRDKDIIICSFTKSKNVSSKTTPILHTKQNLGGSEEPELKTSILEDIRRLNVAITRAKKKLIMVGNRKTLEEFEPFKRLFPLLAPEQLVSLVEP